MNQVIIDTRKNVDNMDSNEQIYQAIDEDTMFYFPALSDNNKYAIYSNLPGRFSVQSFGGQNYNCVAYVYNINAILLWCMKIRSDICMVTAFADIYSYLKI